jgi:hypothetical protein
MFYDYLSVVNLKSLTSNTEKQRGRTMAYASVKARPVPQPRYTVYIYHRPENQIEGQGDWEMRSVSEDLQSALDEAHRLYDSENFKKVEIKQKIHDPRTQSFSDQTLRVLEPGARMAAIQSGLMTAGVLLAGLIVIYAISVLS